jgi:hypothetical protein
VVDGLKWKQLKKVSKCIEKIELGPAVAWRLSRGMPDFDFNLNATTTETLLLCDNWASKYQTGVAQGKQYKV